MNENFENLQENESFMLQPDDRLESEINNIDEIGNILKLENMLKSFEGKINTVKEQIDYTNKQLIDVKEELFYKVLSVS